MADLLWDGRLLWSASSHHDRQHWRQRWVRQLLLCSMLGLWLGTQHQHLWTSTKLQGCSRQRSQLKTCQLLRRRLWRRRQASRHHLHYLAARVRQGHRRNHVLDRCCWNTGRTGGKMSGGNSGHHLECDEGRGDCWHDVTCDDWLEVVWRDSWQWMTGGHGRQLHGRWRTM